VPEVLVKTQTTPENVWRQLGTVAHDWYKRRQDLLHDAKVLSELFSFEEELMLSLR
jgi:hypothetical protein